MAKPQIEPRILKGFRDLLPQEADLRLHLFDIIKEVFRKSCYLPIDTPALEYSEILLGKGSDETDKQLFRFKDQGDRDIALRFDLTVPLARYVSQHRNDLSFPFRRFHIAPVWRAEKPQKGRYREFFQCDFDIIGTESLLADIETLITVSSIFEKIGLKYKIRINHRVILNSLIKNLAPTANPTSILRTVDKLEKMGEDQVLLELQSESKLDLATAKKLLNEINSIKANSNFLKSQAILKENIGNQEAGIKALLDFETLFTTLNDQRLKFGEYCFDISIARGLDYYTGVVFETQLIDFPTLGSVCSGGRYDNLASLFSTQELPGVGGSVGIDRLLVALNEVGHHTHKQHRLSILVTVFSDNLITESFKIASLLRLNSFSSEVYSGKAKLGAQFKYADKNLFDYAIIIGEEEAASEEVVIKYLKSNTENNQEKIKQKDLIEYFNNKSIK